MDLTNCTVTAITAPGAPAKSGGAVTYPAPTTISVPALLTSPTTQQLANLAAREKRATARLRVMKDELPAGVTIKDDYEIRLTVTRTGAAKVLIATDVTETDWHGLSGFRVFAVEGRK